MSTKNPVTRAQEAQERARQLARDNSLTIPDRRLNDANPDGLVKDNKLALDLTDGSQGLGVVVGIPGVRRGSRHVEGASTELDREEMATTARWLCRKLGWVDPCPACQYTVQWPKKRARR